MPATVPKMPPKMPNAGPKIAPMRGACWSVHQGVMGSLLSGLLASGLFAGEVADGPRVGGGEFAAFDELGEQFANGIGRFAVDDRGEAFDDLVEAEADRGVADAVRVGEVLEGAGSEDQLGDEIEVVTREG